MYCLEVICIVLFIGISLFCRMQMSSRVNVSTSGVNIKMIHLLYV